MKEELIKFQTAKLAKEKGFNWMVAHHYTNELVMPKKEVLGASTNGESDKFSAPRQSLLQKWLREEYSIHIYIESLKNFNGWYYIPGRKYLKGGKFKNFLDHAYSYYSYEEALEKGLIEALNSLTL